MPPAVHSLWWKLKRFLAYGMGGWLAGLLYLLIPGLSAQRPPPQAPPATASGSSLPSPSPSGAIVGIERATVNAEDSVTVLDGEVRISVKAIPFSGDPLHHTVDAVVTEVATGAMLPIGHGEVGFDSVFGERHSYDVVILRVGTFDVEFEVRRLPETEQAPGP
jgi:hypothetical protein